MIHLKLDPQHIKETRQKQFVDKKSTRANLDT